MKTKKIISSVLASAMTLSLLMNGPVVHAATKAEVTGDKIAIENDYLKREYTVQDGHVLTSAVINKRINKTLVPAQGSEDFVINTLNPDVEDTGEKVEEYFPEWLISEEAYDSTNWKATLKNADGEAIKDSEVAKLFDNDKSTYINEYQVSGNPFTLDIDFGEELEISGMSVDKRPGYTDAAYGVNGTMGGFEIWVSADGTEYTKVTEGEFTKEAYNLHEENGLYNVGDTVCVGFDTVTTRYVRVVQTGVSLSNAQEFSSSEVDFYKNIEKNSVNPKNALDRTNWSISIKNASGQVFSEEHAKKVIDGDLNTHPDEYTKKVHPFTMDIDMGETKTISSFSVDKRPGYSDSKYGTNGTMGEFELYVSNDGENYQLACRGNFTEEAYNLHQVDNLYNVGDRVYANLQDTVEARYVRLVQNSTSMGNSEEFTTAEFNLFEDKYHGTDWTEDISIKKEAPILSSELTYDKATVDSSVEGERKLTISYKPYEVNGVTYNINQVVVLKDEDHYMRSFLEISVDNPDKAQIDYIDTDRFVIPEDAEGVWCHPDDSKISSMWIGPHELMLGQPIYVDGMFMGSEFPASDNIIKDNATQIRYYSGKTFTKLGEDGQLTTDGKFVTWQNVIGAARGTDTAVVQTDFFEYIEEIATPTEFRKQYNSWYDNMMNITDESVTSSFNGAEKGLAQNGVEPLDSYVIDDGWINYYDGTYLTTPGSSQGTTPNRTGFWEFNAKFPNELYTLSALAQKFDASFGVWVGPQGGYNYFSSFAKFLQASGTGEAQTNAALGTVICTGSRKYLKNFETMIIDYQNRFNVDYWKWDGFASRPCNNPEHAHMTGGDNNMYFTSDMWEAWTDLFDNVRAARAAQGKGLFINATCYVNLSPWLLQWVNTVWVQDSGDTGQLGTGERHQQKIYYRDQVYYQLYKQNQIQFPLKNIYNHDPIYGVSDSSDATTDVFREFLIANAVRGTAFWELYFSPSIIDDAKWRVTADILGWAEENHEVLKNAKLFGNQPKNGVYGYSSWNGAEGIVSFTNPLDTVQEYTLTIDGVAGASEAVQNLKGIQVHPYKVGQLEGTLSYGDDITVTLQPHETIIYHYGYTDNQDPKLLSAKSTGDNELTLRFSERLQNAEFTVNGKAVDTELKEDYRTVVLTTKELLSKDAKVAYTVTDFGNNKVSDTTTVAYYEDGVIANVADGSALKGAPTLDKKYDSVSDTMWLSGLNDSYVVDTTNQLKGVEDFGISVSVKTESTDVDLFNSNNGEVRLSIDKDGYVVFKVKDLVISSKEEITTVTEKAYGTFGTEEYVPTQTEESIIGQVNDGKAHSIAAVREANGMIKLYIDGRLSSSLYDEAHINEALTGGEMKVLGANFAGEVSNIQVLNRAIGYDETAAINENVSDVVTPSHEGWVASACSEMSGTTGDANAMAAIDGNTASWWHTNYVGSDTCTDPHWIAINFNKAETFDKFMYTGRGAKSNGSIKEYRLEIMDENGDYTTIKEGEFSALTADNVIQLDDTYTAYGIRLTALSTHNGANFAAAVEIDIAAPDRELTETELQEKSEALLATVEDIDLSNYSEATLNKFMSVYNKVDNVVRSSALAWAAIENEFNAAKEQLVNVKPLKDVVAQAQALDSDKYTEESYAAVVEALNAAEMTIKNATTMDEVTEATNALQAAMDALEESGTVTTVNKVALEIAVDLANTVTEEDLNELVGAVVKEFNAALLNAKAVLADDNATQADVDAAFDRLSKVIWMLDFKHADMEQLKRFIANEKLEDLLLKDKEYIPSTWTPFADAYKEAKDIVNDENEMDQERVNAAYVKLVKAFVSLRLVPNKDKLAELIAKTEKLDAKMYTAASYAVVTKALDAAKAVMADENATEEDVEAAYAALDKAIKGLEVVDKAQEPTPTKPTDKDEPKDNNNDKPTTGTTNVTTGDNTSVIGLVSVIVVAGAAIALMLFKKKRS